MRKRIDWTWEKLDDSTCRIKVIGGWIVHHHMMIVKGTNTNQVSESMVFVLDKDHEWSILQPLAEAKKLENKVEASDFASTNK